MHNEMLLEFPLVVIVCVFVVLIVLVLVLNNDQSKNHFEVLLNYSSFMFAWGSCNIANLPEA